MSYECIQTIYTYFRRLLITQHNSSRFIQVIVCISILFLLLWFSEYSTMLWMYHRLFSHLPTEGFVCFIISSFCFGFILFYFYRFSGWEFRLLIWNFSSFLMYAFSAIHFLQCSFSWVPWILICYILIIIQFNVYLFPLKLPL